MRLFTILRRMRSWRYVGRSGCWHYWVNTHTGERTCKYAGGQWGSEALHRYWLTGGDWDWHFYPLWDRDGRPILPPPPPPVAGTIDHTPDGC